MRIKVESTPPLAAFKAWFVVSAATNIQDLKEALCSDVPALLEHEVTADEIALVLDGFELLDSSPIDVVRDGDLVNVKSCTPHSQVTVKKRKAENTEALPPPKRAKSAPAVRPTAKASQHAKPTARKPAPSTSSSSSSDTSSDSSDDLNTSSDDSDEDSDSTSDDSSSSSSSSDSAPSVETSKPRQVQLAKTTAKNASQTTAAVSKPKQLENFVPPGQGKTATKNRNLRRRLKRHHERLAAQQASEGLLGANNVPLGTRANVIAQEEAEDVFDATEQDHTTPAPPQKQTQPTFMMASLSNKNKRKGFKQAMASTLPKKIIFATADEEGAMPDPNLAALPFETASSSEVTAAAPNIFPRLIPPSEKQELGQIPANMIVTSIDVEEGLYPERMNKGGKGKKRAEARGQLVRSETQEVENVVLDYGEAGDEDEGQRNSDLIPTQRTVASGAGSLHDTAAVEHDSLSPQTWMSVEKNWETFPKIQDPQSAVVGSLVGWKALALNPATFTPEILLNVGRVTKGEPDANLVVQPIPRPGATQSPISFGARLNVYGEEGEDGYGEEEEEAAVLEEETYEWNEVFSGDWRVLSGL